MKKALCWHGCDLFHHFSFNERLDAVRSSDAADARIQKPPHVHEHQTVKGDLRVFLRLLHTQTRKNTHTPLKHTLWSHDVRQTDWTGKMQYRIISPAWHLLLFASLSPTATVCSRRSSYAAWNESHQWSWGTFYVYLNKTMLLLGEWRVRGTESCLCACVCVCVRLTWIFLQRPGSTSTLCPSSLGASPSPTRCGNLGPAGRIAASDGGLTVQTALPPHQPGIPAWNIRSHLRYPTGNGTLENAWRTGGKLRGWWGEPFICHMKTFYIVLYIKWYV